MKVLCLATFPVEAACSRYRCTQYFPQLLREGIECTFRPLLTAEVFRGLYVPGSRLLKSAQIMAAAARRLRDLAAARTFDVVFIQREAVLFGPPVVEWVLARPFGKPIVFDFDDAIFVPYVSPTYGRIATWLKCPRKTAKTIRLSRQVVAGNPFLADYARRLNRRVTVIPSVVDTEVFRPGPRDPGGVPTIGWIGSPTTTQYLKPLIPILEQLSRTENFRFKVIGANENFNLSGAETINQPWSLEREIADFQSLDIGLYPITESPWSVGKSGFKAIQYMAAGVACVASPVGLNNEILRDGENGMIASTCEEWKSRLLALLREPSLRNRLGRTGRNTVEERYCLRVHAPRLAGVLKSAIQGGAP